ncbi:hypothetical protein DL89DRAFT_88009 [Linderina pennispora]|uniref:Uncharacterized protein n=1 Tax=Linderina pennispora TaxID=61395 RepID=A0A1Y1WIQ2_9FUNG|nr:uncharacterized protein DL89DRAFT_88009 [Linderina pennispora]ORX73096.1 hypothetical protein DL89DRAFT_88009 [Linderina pennispora]
MAATAGTAASELAPELPPVVVALLEGLLADPLDSSSEPADRSSSKRARGVTIGIGGSVRAIGGGGRGARRRATSSSSGRVVPQYRCQCQQQTSRWRGPRHRWCQMQQSRCPVALPSLVAAVASVASVASVAAVAAVASVAAVPTALEGMLDTAVSAALES